MGGFAYPPGASEPGPGKEAGPPDSTSGKPGNHSKKDTLRTDAGGPAKQVHITSSNELRQIYTCDPHASGQQHSDCRLTTLKDGAVLLVRSDTSPAAPTRTADLLRPDGTRVVVAAVGGSLTEAQLRTIAASPRWQQWVAPAVNDKAAGKTP
ncbi:hypothetical protein AB0436_09690 [Streptomyces sp. NPDC051322]|uniref:hypothetical protein n=1 Tax=Streptomyces sp. NPDC051322 TaxID=3154645 RepID=UPI00344C21C5